MGVRDDFLSLLTAGQNSANQFATGAVDMRKRAELARLSQELPDMLNSGQLNEAASSMFGAGEAGPIREIFQSQLKAQTPGKPSLTVPEIEAMAGTLGVSVPRPVAESLAKLSADDQLAQLNAFQSNKETSRQQGLMEREATRRGEQWKDKQSEGFGKPLRQSREKAKEKLDQLEIQLKLLGEMPNEATKRSVAVTMARLAGEAGALSNQDLDAYNLRTFFGDVDRLKAYITSDPNVAIPDEIQDAMIEMGKAISKEKGSRVEQSLKRQMVDLLAENVDLLDIDGKGSKAPAVKQWEKTLGVQVDLDKDGVPVVRDLKSKKTTEKPGISKTDGGQVVDAASLVNRVNKLKVKDPALAAELSAILQGKIEPEDEADINAALTEAGF